MMETKNDTVIEKRLKNAAEELGINPDILDFPHLFNIKQDETGPYVQDTDGILRYYVETGRVRLSPDYAEAFDICDGCDSAGVTPRAIMQY